MVIFEQILHTALVLPLLTLKKQIPAAKLLKKYFKIKPALFQSTNLLKIETSYELQNQRD